MKPKVKNNQDGVTITGKQPWDGGGIYGPGQQIYTLLIKYKDLDGLIASLSTAKTAKETATKEEIKSWPWAE